MLVRCDCCAGKKTIIGLGNIAKKCHACKGLGFKECDDLVTTCHSATTVGSVQQGLIVSDATLHLVANKNNDSQPPVLSKKELQSAKMKEAWAKRKAKEAK